MKYWRIEIILFIKQFIRNWLKILREPQSYLHIPVYSLSKNYSQCILLYMVFFAMLTLEIIKMITDIFKYILNFFLLILVCNLIHRSSVVTLRSKPSAVKDIDDIENSIWGSLLFLKQFLHLESLWKLSLKIIDIFTLKVNDVLVKYQVYIVRIGSEEQLIKSNQIHTIYSIHTIYYCNLFLL